MRRVLISTILCCLVATGPRAAEPPQALLLVAAGDIALQCSEGECAADATTLCLQPERERPRRGTPYAIVGEEGVRDAITLIGRTGDGRAVELPMGIPIRITAERTFLAVKISISDTVLRGSEFDRVAVRIRKSLILAPSDPGSAQGGDDLSRVVRDLRPEAEGQFRGHRDQVAAAQFIHDVTNGLPRGRFVSHDELLHAWQDATDAMTPAAKALSPRASSIARDALETCAAPSTAAYARRTCLGGMHDRIMRTINHRYWDSLKAGS